MIKVNLARTRVQGESPTVIQSGGGASSENKELVFKLLFLTLGTVGLMLYEKQNIDNLRAQNTRLAAQVQEMENQAQAKAKEVEAIKDVASKAQDLENKLKVLKMLSQLRLREVKTLDFIQGKIPEKVWLKKIEYKANEKQFELGSYNFEGSAVTTDDLSDFIKRLEESTFLNEVILLKNQEMALQGKSTSIRNYIFTAQVETKP